MVKCGTLRKDKGKPDCWIGIHQWPPPRELQWRSPPLEESWSQSLTMTPRENTDSVSKDKLEKQARIFPFATRLADVWDPAEQKLFLFNSGSVSKPLFIPTLQTRCFSFPFCCRAIKAKLFPFPLILCSNRVSSWTELSHHKSDSTQLQRWHHGLTQTRSSFLYFYSLLTSLGMFSRCLT